MTASIIGCNGYIGKHLAKFLLGKSWEIYGYDISEFSKTDGVKYSSLKLLLREDANAINLNTDFVFFFAGVTGITKAYYDYEPYLDVNEKSLLHLLDRMRAEKFNGRIIFPSTRLVYKGGENIPLDENAAKEFRSIYALNKWFGESVIMQYQEYFGVNYNIFRICVPYGNLFPDAYSYGTIGFFLNDAMLNKKIILYGTGEQKRTFTHIEDICNQIYTSIIDKRSINQIYNIPGENFSLREVATKIASRLNVPVENKEWPDLDKKLETGDILFDGSKLISSFGIQQIHFFDSWVQEVK